MEWKERGTFTPKAGDAYLAYGDQLNSHMPGIAVVKWNRYGEEWVAHDDPDHYYRDAEIDYLLALKSIELPKGVRGVTWT